MYVVPENNIDPDGPLLQIVNERHPETGWGVLMVANRDTGFYVVCDLPECAANRAHIFASDLYEDADKFIAERSV